MRPSVLVTGAGGLVGDHVVAALEASCRLLTVARDAGPTTLGGGACLQADLRDPRCIDSLQTIAPDLVVHLAAAIPAGASDTEAIATNTSIDANVRALAHAAGCAVVFASSVSVYAGHPGPWLESMPLQPASAYGLQKLRSEHSLADAPGGSLSLRISSPYGRSRRPRTGILYRFLAQASAGEPLTVLGDGERTQDFVHAADVARAIRMAVEGWRPRTGLAVRGVANIASGRPVSMHELAALALALTGNAQPLRYAPGGGAEEAYRSHVSIEHARAVLGWTPMIELRDGLADLLNQQATQ